MSTTPEEINCNTLNYSAPSQACIKAPITGKNSTDCRNGLVYIACIDEVNKCVNTYNNTNRQKRSDEQSTWDREDRENKTAQSNWDNAFANKKRDIGNEDHRPGCGGCGTNPGCPGGMYEHRGEDCGHRGWLCQRVCRKNGDIVEREAREQVGNRPGDKGGRPGDWANVQNAVASSVYCCNNLVNIVNGQVENSNFTQTCMVESSGTGGAGAGGGTTTGSQNTSNFDSDGSRTDTVDDEYTGEEDDEDDSNMFLILIVLIVFILCSCVAGILLISDD